MCHVVLMLPLFGLAVFWLWPLSVALPVYLFILLFSAGLDLLIIRALHRPVQTGAEGMLHQRGVALEDFRTLGRVFVHGENWQARTTHPLQKGDRVEVIGMNRLVLVVRAESGNATS